MPEEVNRYSSLRAADGALWRKIHITGGAGAGKSTLARQLSRMMAAPVFELDGRALDWVASLGQPLDLNVLSVLRREEAKRFTDANDAWISEGSCVQPYHAFYKQADLIVFLEVPWQVASYRILTRHLKATLARNNRFPGWLRLYRFWRWSARYYADRNPYGFNEWGTPETQSTLQEVVRGYSDKLVFCRSKREIKELLSLFISHKL